MGVLPDQVILSANTILENWDLLHPSCWFRAVVWDKVPPRRPVIGNIIAREELKQRVDMVKACIPTKKKWSKRARSVNYSRKRIDALRISVRCVMHLKVLASETRLNGRTVRMVAEQSGSVW